MCELKRSSNRKQLLRFRDGKNIFCLIWEKCIYFCPRRGWTEKNSADEIQQLECPRPISNMVKRFFCLHVSEEIRLRILEIIAFYVGPVSWLWLGICHGGSKPVGHAFWLQIVIYRLQNTFLCVIAQLVTYGRSCTLVDGDALNIACILFIIISYPNKGGGIALPQIYF